ncbi:MAG TPA: patatin-like phospholipase family protein, partial [Gemmatimonadaceae bacterium]|nr:patatin-like phospholipase family protein [Gemmatimonadaceae bacterium]
DGRIPRIAAHVASGALRAVGIITTDYASGESITWIEGNGECMPWVRPKRRGVIAELRLEHVMASAALPFFFPAVRVGERWHGDGGIRLTSPLQPALALGADRIIVVSTRPELAPAPVPAPTYPSPAQILGVLYNAIFVDNVDEDAHRLARTNALLRRLAPEQRDGLRTIELQVVRPSRDPGGIAKHYERFLPKAFRYLTRGLGTRDRSSTGDILSLVLFQPQYLSQLISLGEEDGERIADSVSALLSPGHAGGYDGNRRG